MRLTNLKFLNGGYCRQWARLTGAASWKWVRFYAVFVYFEHPTHGSCLIDSGYSPQFQTATKRFPQRFYRWLTPTTLDPACDPSGVMRASGLDPDGLRHVFVSHFHADHICGLRQLSQPSFVYRGDSLQRLRGLRVRQQVAQGFLSELLPDDFESRGQPVADQQLTSGQGDWSGIDHLDYWNDGSLILVDLPGHADGHTGFVLRAEHRDYFYVVDATWNMNVLEQSRRLPMLGRWVQHNQADYDKSQQSIKRLISVNDYCALACHCPRTQQHVV